MLYMKKKTVYIEIDSDNVLKKTQDYSNFDNVFVNLSDVLEKVDSQLLSPLIGTLKSYDNNPQNDPLMISRHPPQGFNPGPGFGQPYPSRFPQQPFFPNPGFGSSDLDPFQGGPTGFHPGFPNSGPGNLMGPNSFYPPAPGRLGGPPQGARFDPYGPSSFHGEPDFDDLTPPRNNFPPNSNRDHDYFM